IVLIDWRRRGDRIDGSRAVRFSMLPSGLSALIALAVGFVVSIPFMNQTLYVGPAATALGGADIAYLVGFVVAGALYWGPEPRVRKGGPIEGQAARGRT